MKTIVIPVDFSEASMNAADYALEFAGATECSLSFIHVCQVPVAYSEIALPAVVLPEMIEDAKERLAQIKKKLLAKTDKKIQIYTDVKEGDIISEIDGYCKALQPYALVMGARGIGVVERTLFGSVTLSAIRRLSWPLIIVPVGASFRNITRIGLATDLKDVVNSVHAKTIKKIVNDFGAELHVLHVYTGTSSMTVAEEVEQSAWLREMLEQTQPIFHFFNDENVEEAINQFAEKIDLDLLLIIPKNHGLLDRIMHKSQSKQLALHAHIPLMSIHE